MTNIDQINDNWRLAQKCAFAMTHDLLPTIGSLTHDPSPITYYPIL
jgi:hypothetical protein